MAKQRDEECGSGFSLPYDGITRTGSKGLSQLHQYRYGTPNDKGELTGIDHIKQGWLVTPPAPQDEKAARRRLAGV